MKGVNFILTFVLLQFIRLDSTLASEQTAIENVSNLVQVERSVDYHPANIRADEEDEHMHNMDEMNHTEGIESTEEQSEEDKSNEPVSHMTEDSEASHSDISGSTISPVPHVMKHNHGVPILETHLEPEERLFWENYNTTTYFNVPSKHRSALYWHIGCILVSFIIIYPIFLVLNNVGSSWSYPILFLHGGLVLFGLLNYSIFIKSIPNLYPGNAFNPMSWILAFSVIFQLFFAVLSFGYKLAKSTGLITEQYASLSDTDLDSHAESWTSHPITLYDLRENSGSFDINANLEDQEVLMATKTSKNSMVSDSNKGGFFLTRIVGLPVVHSLINFFGKFSVVVFDVLNWANFFYFLVYFPTGIAVFGLFGKGKSVFNLLAHFIKGGVFFSLGLLTLARYLGAFQNKGWSWNHKYVTYNDVKRSRWARLQSKGLCTMEMIESSLIAFYGCTNVFLEHLSNRGAAYSAKDLQHASIAFIYIGCGFCGIFVEMKSAGSRYNRAIADFEAHNSSDESKKVVKASPGYSMNLLPIFTIYWTGVLMSKHEQASHLSTEIHVQWGNMFVAGVFVRFCTYLYLYLGKPPKDLAAPARPFTEVITAFCLICGGMIFMESTDPVILAFEYAGYTAMFTLNISIGVSALLMAWIMTVFTFKDYIKSRKQI